MRIALCQLDPTVGAIDDNISLVVDAVARASALGADLAVTPELVVSGYPAEDLWSTADFVRRCERELRRRASEFAVPTVIGVPRLVAHEPRDVRNTAWLIRGGVVAATYDKHHLPNYAVFDEHRWFRAGHDVVTFDIDEVSVGITICEDAWVSDGPVPRCAQAGADVVINLSASPWRLDRSDVRERVASDRAREGNCWFVLCNQVGGQDELVFDGQSVVAAPDGTITARAAAFEPDLLVVDVDVAATTGDAAPARNVTNEAELWAGLVCGLRSYVRKNGFRSVILGLSGGIDSALVLALAVDALGADRVHAVTMPSRFSSDDTRGDAHQQAERLGVRIAELAIEPVVGAFTTTLATEFAGREPDVAEENLQARIRGTLLMALSNKFGHLLLATGNKSEMSVGYATLYGDMNGGFAPLKDIYKSTVFRLARWRNSEATKDGVEDVIPPSVVDRSPTAELRADQKDSDSLPEYDVLDSILQLLVDEDASIEDAVAAGYQHDVVVRVRRLVDRAEYKRRQSAPGVRASDKAFGRDRRMPITNAWDGRETSP